MFFKEVLAITHWAESTDFSTKLSLEFLKNSDAVYKILTGKVKKH